MFRTMALLGLLVVALAVPSQTLAATAGSTVNRTDYSVGTTGASLSGAFTKTNASGAISYNVSFALKDTGNEGYPVYAKWRYQVLVSDWNGVRWTTTAAKLFTNTLGYGSTSTGSSRLSQASLDQIASNAGSTVPAIKLRLQVQVCRDAPTDNCSAYTWATWTTYSANAFGPGFNCNGTTMMVDMRGIEGFVHGTHLLNSPFTLVVEPVLLRSTDATFTSPATQALPPWIIVYPLGWSTVSYVYLASDLSTPRQGDFSVTMTPGYYYAMMFNVWLTTSNASDSYEFPTQTFATYSFFQNGQGTYGDWRCIAR